MINWNELTSDPSSYPDSFIRVLIIAYNKELNQSVITASMHEGSYGPRQRWSCILFTENEIKWYTLDESWEITHWADLLIPETIDKINKAKKITKF